MATIYRTLFGEGKKNPLQFTSNLYFASVGRIPTGTGRMGPVSFSPVPPLGCTVCCEDKSLAGGNGGNSWSSVSLSCNK